MPNQPWPSEWLRGLLSLAVLRVVSTGPTYGYQIATTLEEQGFGAIKGGTLYPLLTRLESGGQIVGEWREGDGGPGRKYFTLTNEGREQFAAQARQWQAFAQHTTHFLTQEQS